MQFEIFWETPHTQLGALLSYISSLPMMLSSYNILFSLSLSQSLRIVTFMLKEPATGYSKITTDLTIEPELDSSSMSYNTDDD